MDLRPVDLDLNTIVNLFLTLKTFETFAFVEVVANADSIGVSDIDSLSPRLV
jgi:hypothetical protein